MKPYGQSPVLRQFLLFSAIGAAAFLVDAGILMLIVHVTSLGLYAGRAGSFLCAATFTWLLNRRFTFPEAERGAWTTQWIRFLGANAIGALANLGVYAWLISAFPAITRQPAIAVAAGSLSGLLFNFTLSRMFVFRSRIRRTFG